MSRTIAVHVRYKSLYISLPSSAKQQREMTNSAVFNEREVRQLIFLKDMVGYASGSKCSLIFYIRISAFTLFITVKAIAKLNLGCFNKFEMEF